MPPLKLLLSIPVLLLSGCTRHHAQQALFSHGADPNQKDAAGLTALIRSARAGAVPGVETLLRHGADPNLRGGVNNWTPLMHAVHKNQLGAAQALLDGGAQVDSRGRSGETALMMAAGYGYTPLVELLLERGAKLSTEREPQLPMVTTYWRPLSEACPISIASRWAPARPRPSRP